MKTCTKCGVDSKDDAAWCPTCLCTSWATERKMTQPTLADLSVYRRDAEVFEVTSWLTRGRCATVYKFSFSKHFNVRVFLIPSYMQGITDSLIVKAVESFLEQEKAAAEQKANAEIGLQPA